MQVKRKTVGQRTSVEPHASHGPSCEKSMDNNTLIERCAGESAQKPAAMRRHGDHGEVEHGKRAKGTSPRHVGIGLDGLDDDVGDGRRHKQPNEGVLRPAGARPESGRSRKHEETRSPCAEDEGDEENDGGDDDGRR